MCTAASNTSCDLILYVFLRPIHRFLQKANNTKLPSKWIHREKPRRNTAAAATTVSNASSSNVEKAAHYISSASAIPSAHMCKQHLIVMCAFGQKNNAMKQRQRQCQRQRQRNTRNKRSKEKRKENKNHHIHIAYQRELISATFILLGHSTNSKRTRHTHTRTHWLISISFTRSAVCMGARHRLPLPSLPYSLTESRAYPHTVNAYWNH